MIPVKVCEGRPGQIKRVRASTNNVVDSDSSWPPRHFCIFEPNMLRQHKVAFIKLYL